MFSKSHEAFSRKQHSPHAAGCFCLDSSIWRKTTPKFPGQHFGRPLREKSVQKAFPQGAKRSHEDPSCKVRFQGKVGSCARMMTRPVTRPYTMGLPPSKSPLPPVSVPLQRPPPPSLPSPHCGFRRIRLCTRAAKWVRVSVSLHHSSLLNHLSSQLRLDVPGVVWQHFRVL